VKSLFISEEKYMTRTMAREIAVQLVFSLAGRQQDTGELLESFFNKEYYESLTDESELFAEYPSKKQRTYIYAVVNGVSEHVDEIDSYIEKYAKGWKISRISRIALSILRTAIFEVLYMDEVPDSVAINEAVELSKGYVEQETVSFINGILGSFMRGERGFSPLQDEPIEQEAEEAPAEEKEASELEKSPSETMPEEG
jgi:N utilization substance protein B